ncbi:hypothetical protein BDY19DRAFT_888093 [Irpex rosettiformis]|uniref:Uncharacterized protein n=1 Tax=Irpex rosettiformis TaxID=378272 RepID=A0ACB8U863_9APHY|nr:hypothetical protein BDY19DRAFT_888093 [Irpex rosettiformis]
MDASDPEPQEELTVTFMPALYIQRRAWVFDVMRRERVTQVLDVGCGEGQIVECLCNAAPWLPLQSASDVELDAASRREEQDFDYKDDFIHVRTLHALDVSLDDLRYVLEVTAPPPPPTGNETLPTAVRWEPLDVNVWHGGVQAYNPNFVDIECIVSTEVIEHLPPEVLPLFAPMLLGAYHPRLLLVTTPSYTFNDRFIAPDAPPGTRQGTADPTGRTNRIFRHWDHKFEWTVQEFTEWCEEMAMQWGYEVEVSGVGVPREKDPYERDEQLGRASQVAVFKRKEDEGMASMREKRCAELQTLTQARKEQAHELLQSCQHNTDPRARQVGTLEDIGQAVLQRMDTYDEGHMTIHSLWYDHEIMLLCGGWLQRLIAAVKATASLTLEKPEGKGASDWVAQREGFVPKPVLQTSDTQPHDSHIDISPWTNTVNTGWGADNVLDLDEAGWNPWPADEPWGASGVGWDIDSGPEVIAGIA